ncbi:unnamed protein product [Arctogadus glacialis]
MLTHCRALLLSASQCCRAPIGSRRRLNAQFQRAGSLSVSPRLPAGPAVSRPRGARGPPLEEQQRSQGVRAAHLLDPLTPLQLGRHTGASCRPRGPQAGRSPRVLLQRRGGPRWAVGGPGGGVGGGGGGAGWLGSPYGSLICAAQMTGCWLLAPCLRVDEVHHHNHVYNHHLFNHHLHLNHQLCVLHHYQQLLRQHQHYHTSSTNTTVSTHYPNQHHRLHPLPQPTPPSPPTTPTNTTVSTNYPNQHHRLHPLPQPTPPSPPTTPTNTTVSTNYPNQHHRLHPLPQPTPPSPPTTLTNTTVSTN